jgi:hypothetical protein
MFSLLRTFAFLFINLTAMTSHKGNISIVVVLEFDRIQRRRTMSERYQADASPRSSRS